MFNDESLRTDLTDSKCKFCMREEYDKNNDYEIDLCGHDGEQCIVGLFDGECYNVKFSDGSNYDAFPEELFKLCSIRQLVLEERKIHKMITQEHFDRIENEHGCGYWGVCWEHTCPCAITTEHKGLQKSIYNSLVQEGKEVAKDFENEIDDYIPDNDCEYDDFDNDEDNHPDCDNFCDECSVKCTFRKQNYYRK